MSVTSDIRNVPQLSYGVCAWKNTFQIYVEGAVITFENILFNMGDAYDPTTSFFTCPEDGIYFVSLTLQR